MCYTNLPPIGPLGKYCGEVDMSEAVAIVRDLRY